MRRYLVIAGNVMGLFVFCLFLIWVGSRLVKQPAPPAAVMPPVQPGEALQRKPVAKKIAKAKPAPVVPPVVAPAPVAPQPQVAIPQPLVPETVINIYLSTPVPLVPQPAPAPSVSTPAPQPMSPTSTPVSAPITPRRIVNILSGNSLSINILSSVGGGGLGSGVAFNGYGYGWSGPRWVPGYQRWVCEGPPPPAGPGCYWKWEPAHYE